MEGKIHFTRPPKAQDISGLPQEGLVVHMPKGAFVRLSAKARKGLDAKGAEVVIAEARGRPIGLPMEKILEVVELHRDNRAYRQIEEITGIPKSTCHYLVKYAERQKLRSNGKTVYL
ncbi:Uncharacterised protein [uncultured archaeon]|nr:Uncharacterised protein [uncultured archaeon]